MNYQQIIEIGKQAASNKLISYIFSRYFIYFIQFVNSLFIAVYLGPFYLGVWGFITLIIQYFVQSNFGINHSLNAIIAIKKDKIKYVTMVFNTSLTMVSILSLIVIVLFSINTLFFTHIGSQYTFIKYSWAVCSIAILNYYIGLFLNLFRVYNKLFEIAFSQSIFPILMLVCTFMSKGEDLVNYLVATNIISLIVSLSLFVWKCPVIIKAIFPISLANFIFWKGLYLFLYNTSFYLIMISTRSFISSYYSVEQFGYFTFAFTMASAIFLLLESISFLIYPKMLNRLAKANNKDALKIIDNLRNVYMVSSHGLVHFAVLFFPLFLYFFPDYQKSSNDFRLIALTMVLYTNSFGYSNLLIAKGKEKLIGGITFIALLVNITFAYILTVIVRVDYTFVIVSTTITYLLYVGIINFIGCRILNHSITFWGIISKSFTFRLTIPLLVSLVLIFIRANNFIFFLPCLFFLILNRKTLINSIDILYEIIKRPTFADI